MLSPRSEPFDLSSGKLADAAVGINAHPNRVLTFPALYGGQLGYFIDVMLS
jgi:hypothetical protein